MIINIVVGVVAEMKDGGAANILAQLEVAVAGMEYGGVAEILAQIEVDAL